MSCCASKKQTAKKQGSETGKKQTCKPKK